MAAVAAEAAGAPAAAAAVASIVDPSRGAVPRRSAADDCSAAGTTALAGSVDASTEPEPDAGVADRVATRGSMDELRADSEVEFVGRLTPATRIASGVGSAAAAAKIADEAVVAAVFCGCGTVGVGEAGPAPAGADATVAAGVVAAAADSESAKLDASVGASAAGPAAGIADAETLPAESIDPTAAAEPPSETLAEELSEPLLRSGCGCSAADTAPAVAPLLFWFVAWFLVGSAAGAPSSAPRGDRLESVFDLAAFVDPFVVPASLLFEAPADGEAGLQVVDVGVVSRRAATGPAGWTDCASVGTAAALAPPDFAWANASLNVSSSGPGGKLIWLGTGVTPGLRVTLLDRPIATALPGRRRAS